MNALLLLLVSAFLSTQISDPAASANELAKGCRYVIAGNINDDTALDSGYCVGLITGFVNAVTLSGVIPGNQKLYCAPSGMTVEQAIRIFVKYADDHPEELHLIGSGMLYKSLRAAFPCPAKL